MTPVNVIARKKIRYNKVLMVSTRQTNIEARIRIQRIAGRVALITGVGLFIYGLFATGALPSLIVTKPNYSCANAPAAGAPVLDQGDRQQLALQLDGAARELWRDQREYRRTSTNTTLAMVRRSLATRKDALVRTMRVSPEAAVAALLTKTERTNLTKLAANCIESSVTYQGTLQSTHLDDFSGDESLFQNTLTTSDGTQLQLHIAHTESRDLPSGSTVRVRGYQIGNDVLVDAAAAPAGAGVDTGDLAVLSVPAAPAVTNNRVAVIMAYYSDEAQPASPTVGGVNTLLNTTINGYYQENSYGKVGYTGDVYGWYQVPIASTNCAYGPVSAAALAAADPDIDFTQYTHLVTMFRSVGPTCPFAGLAGLSRSVVQTGEGPRYMYSAYVGVASAYVMGHELGHNLGNHHAQYYPCDPPYTDYYYVYYNAGCMPVEYGDLYDIMGGSYTGHFNAIHKEATSFFDPGMIMTVPPGTHEYVLEPIETATTNLKALKILRGDNTVGGSDDYLYVEYRQPIGYDASFSGYSRDMYDGAVLHTMGAGQLYSGLFDPTPAHRGQGSATLPVGSTYVDPMSGVTVQTTGQTSDALAVTITTGRTDLTPPSMTITDPSYGQTVAGSINIAANATDASGIDRVDFYVGSKVNPPFFTDTTAPYSATLDTTQLPNGSTRVVATAYDLAGQAQGLPGNWFSTERTFIVDNADAIPPTVSLATPTAGASIISGAVSFSANASDNIAIWKVEFYIDGSSTPTLIDTTAPYAGSANLFTLGSHTLMAAAYDLAGNRVDTADLSFSIVDDTANPSATLVAPINNAVVSGLVQVTLTTNDDSGYVNSAALVIDGQYNYIGKPTATYSYWWDSRSVVDGDHQFAVQVGDNAGFQYLSPAITTTVDNSLPVVTIDSPAAGAVASTTNIIVTANHARGISRVDFYRDGALLIGSDASAPYQLAWDTQTISPGAHTITARAVSTTGTNATSAAVNVTTSDLTPPTVTLDAPSNGATIDGAVALAATAADSPMPSTPRVEFYLDGATLLGTDSTVPYTLAWDGYSVAPGSHTLMARAVDGATNYTDSAPITIVVLAPDLTSPNATLDLTAR